VSLDYPPCTRPPTGWRCTLDADHQGPCPTVVDYQPPSPLVVAAYERAIRAVEMAVIARVPRWARVRRLDDTTRRAIAELFAEAHTIADQEAQ